MVRVELFTRVDCGLCDEAKAVLRAVRKQHLFDLVEIDIDGDAALREQYGHEIPVVHVDGRKAFKYRLEPSAVLARIRRAEEHR